jgi:hypothetical protein
MRTTLVLALMMICNAAQASEWALLHIDGEGSKTYIDVSSIRVKGGSRWVWEKFVFAPGEPKYSSFVTRNAFDCGEEMYQVEMYQVEMYQVEMYQVEMYQVESFTVYYKDGRNDRLPPPAPLSAWAPVVPDTGPNYEMRLVCGWNPVRAQGFEDAINTTCKGKEIQLFNEGLDGDKLAPSALAYRC